MNKKTYLAAVLSVVFWGSSFPAFKFALRSLAAYDVVALRYIVATVLLGFFLLINRSKWPACFSIKGLAFVALMALFEPVLYFYLEGQALQYTSAGQAGMLTALIPVLTILLARLFLRERLNRKRLFGVVLATIGVVLLTVAGEASLTAPNPLLGNFLEVLAMISAAGYVILSRFLSRDYSPLFLTFAMGVIGSLAFLPPMLASDGGLPPLNDATLAGYGAAIYLGVAATFLAYFLFNYVLKNVSAAEAAVFTNLIAPTALLLSQLSGVDLPMNFVQWLSCGIILAGVVLAQNWQRQKRVKR